MDVKQIDHRYIANTYARYPVVFTHGVGSKLYDESGKEYIDCSAGIGVNSLGYHHEAWIQAVCEQTSKLAHISNLYYTKADVEVAQTLCERTGMKKVFFANSGAEANEGAIKVARKYANDKYGDKRFEIITLINSFHGRTITTLSATGQEHFHQHFYPFTQGFVHSIANDIEDLKANINASTCAIMIELIQGEGGVLPLNKDYVKELFNICKEQDILCIVDEVQTGIGRTGSLFAYEQYEITPDIVTSAKGLGNGLPIGAVLLNEKVEHTLGYGDHGTTFGGNPIACAGAQVVLQQLNVELLKDVKSKGEYLKKRLLAMPHIEQVHGMGLMRGAKLTDIQAKDVVNACLKEGVLLLTAKDKLRFLPPLTITKQELKKALDILENILKNWEVPYETLINIG